jgi:hypothetical protein
MTVQKLASEIAKREGGKSQARIGDIRQVLKIITEIYGDFLAKEHAKDLAKLEPTEGPLKNLEQLSIKHAIKLSKKSKGKK